MRASIRFFLGAGCVVAAGAGAFYRIPWFYFAVLFAGGCGLMGQRSVWEKMILLARGTPSAPAKGSSMERELQPCSELHQIGPVTSTASKFRPSDNQKSAEI